MYGLSNVPRSGYASSTLFCGWDVIRWLCHGKYLHQLRYWPLPGWSSPFEEEESSSGGRGFKYGGWCCPLRAGGMVSVVAVFHEYSVLTISLNKVLALLAWQHWVTGYAFT